MKLHDTIDKDTFIDANMSNRQIDEAVRNTRGGYDEHDKKRELLEIKRQAGRTVLDAAYYDLRCREVLALEGIASALFRLDITSRGGTLNTVIIDTDTTT